MSVDAKEIRLGRYVVSREVLKLILICTPSVLITSENQSQPVLEWSIT